MSTHTVQLIEEDGELILPFPEEVLKESGFKLGDILNWSDNGDGSITLTKQETELVLVETISTHRICYFVEVPKGHKDFALDTVTCENVNEFSQKHLGEMITSHRVVSKDEALRLFDEENPNFSSLSDEQKLAMLS